MQLFSANLHHLHLYSWGSWPGYCCRNRRIPEMWASTVVKLGSSQYRMNRCVFRDHGWGCYRVCADRDCLRHHHHTIRFCCIICSRWLPYAFSPPLIPFSSWLTYYVKLSSHYFQYLPTIFWQRDWKTTKNSHWINIYGLQHGASRYRSKTIISVEIVISYCTVVALDIGIVVREIHFEGDHLHGNCLW